MSMPHPQEGSFPLFRFKGIQVSLHWSWLLVAVYQINRHRGRYDSIGWAIAEYVSLFLIVLLHEFGHALATRQVGGKSENILLWPFGGIAFINAPPRPGAFLWAIAAGPLVNVALVPVLWLLNHYMPVEANPNLAGYVEMMQWINIALLIFNLLPIYPMDGGQILQSLLWFKLGYAKALLIATGVGLAGGVALMGLMWYYEFTLLSIALTAFMLMNCWKAFQAARRLLNPLPPPPPPVFSGSDN